MCKTIAYLRVSADMQDIDSQRHEIDRYAEFHQLDIQEYIEVEMSSRKSTKKRGIDDLILNLRRGDVLIVSELSRLGRSIRDITNTIDDLLKKKVEIHIIKQGVIARDNDLNTKIMVNSFAMAAEIERELISQRTKAGVALARQRGKQIGNPNLKVDNARRIADADEFAEGLRGIITGLTDSGLTQRQIVEELNKAGIKTARGGKWQLITLQRMLNRMASRSQAQM